VQHCPGRPEGQVRAAFSILYGSMVSATSGFCLLSFA
jgi:hypothetical protein